MDLWIRRWRDVGSTVHIHSYCKNETLHLVASKNGLCFMQVKDLITENIAEVVQV